LDQAELVNDFEGGFDCDCHLDSPVNLHHCSGVSITPS